MPDFPFQISAMADLRNKISSDIWDHMPHDLQEHLVKQKSLPNVSICEREPANVETEVIDVGPFKMKVYYPTDHRTQTLVVMHLPGGCVTYT